MHDGQLTLVYTEGGGVAHILTWSGSPNDRGAKALCGRTPWPGFWHGTGTQEEEERVRDLRLCSPCGETLAEERQRVVTR